MNKLMGFFELKDSGLPAVPWREFDENVNLNENLLWTIRTAIDRGDDLNLPRIVGVKANEAYDGALNLYNKYRKNGIVVYYPYFIAKKSGTLCVDSFKIVIEAVNKDLWNFVTYNEKDVTIIINNDSKIRFDGNMDFLKEDELSELYTHGLRIRRLFRDIISEGQSILLEWSYAHNTDVNRKPIGDQYLVFYEIRTI